MEKDHYQALYIILISFILLISQIINPKDRCLSGQNFCFKLSISSHLEGKIVDLVSFSCHLLNNQTAVLSLQISKVKNGPAGLQCNLSPHAGCSFNNCCSNVRVFIPSTAIEGHKETDPRFQVSSKDWRSPGIN